MILWFVLLIPLAAAFLVLACRGPRLVVGSALVAGALEILSIGVAAWNIHVKGALEAGRYLRADGLTSFFLINLALISALVLIY